MTIKAAQVRIFFFDGGPPAFTGYQARLIHPDGKTLCFQQMAQAAGKGDVLLAVADEDVRHAATLSDDRWRTFAPIISRRGGRRKQCYNQRALCGG
jgi:hypothetical protein